MRFEWVRAARHVDSGARTVHINTSAAGGGVAELLAAVTAPARGRSSGWGVVRGDAAFYAFTKNLHHLFHGRGDPALLASAARDYRPVLADAAREIARHLRPADTLVLHDPQTLGLAPLLRPRVRRLAWHCHIGTRTGPPEVRAALWSLYAPDVPAVDEVLVVDAAYVSGSQARRVVEVAPATDPDSAKNRELGTAELAALLQDTGLTAGSAQRAGATPAGRVWQQGAVPATAPVVLQVSRWDPLKGMADVVRSAEHLPPDVHLVLAGPEPAEVRDDPEGVQQLDIALDAWDRLPDPVRDRVHLVTLSGRDRIRNALWVNALQRRADVVVQRSVEEGFGLTVTEAMLKARPVVVTGVGGLALQVEHEVTGLVAPPHDEPFAAAVGRLTTDPALRDRIGAAARASASARYLIDRLVADYDALSVRSVP